MSIPPRFLNELRDRLTLSDVIGQRLKLTRAGREYKACCPFHKEKTPSFYINDDKQFYHCFGCGAHGDALNFVIQHDNLSFIDAVEVLAAKAGMKVPQQTPQEIERAKREKTLHELVEETARFFQAQLGQGENREARRYLNDRGLDQEQIEQFRIGFAPADGHALYQYLKDKGFEDRQMIEAGVCGKSKKGGNPYAFFRDRVMFPVTDRRGRVVAFGGRILPEHLRPPQMGDYKPPKYINSSDNPLFHKGRMLYSEGRARRAAADGQNVIVVEGYLDVIACVSAGFKGAVAPLGTALTEDQIQVLWNMIPQDEKIPVLCFDGDNAGRMAASRACERLLPLLRANQSARFAFLPDGQDPDSLIKAQGRRAFEKVIEAAIPLSDFIWSYHTAGKAFQTPESRAGLNKVMEAEAAKIQDPVVQKYYIQIFREKIYQTFGASRLYNNKSGKKGRAGSQLGANGNLAGLRRPTFSHETMTAQIFLAAAINHPFLITQHEEDIANMPIGNERLDLLRQAVLNHCTEMMSEHEGDIDDMTDIDPEALKRYLIEKGFETEIRAILSESVYTHAAFCRPKAERDKAAAGWEGMAEMARRNAEKGEWQKGWQEIGRNFDPDAEKRIMAMSMTERYGSHED